MVLSPLFLIFFGASLYPLRMWTRRRTVVAGRTDGDNDWTVYKDRQPVGRVYATHISDPALRWMWVVQVGPVGQGYAPDLPEALEEVRRRFG